MKNILLDDSISKFRDFVHDEINLDYMYKVYNLTNEKNKWNCICSCIQWIDVSRDYINNVEFDTENFNKKCMQVYLYISSIDVILESINQLHRVIYNTTKQPFRGKKDIFNSNLNLDDNNHFKEIRAAFGAHPVNLKDRNDEDVKYFASWPFENRHKFIHSEYDFYCNLYPNCKEIKDKVIGFKFNQLNEFLIQRYSYINKLKTQLEKDIKKFVNNFIDSVPELVNNPIEDIYNLKKFLSSYFESNRYDYTLDKLETIFKVYENYPNPNVIINQYIEELGKVIVEIHSNLTKGKFKELDTKYIISPSICNEYVNDSETYPKSMIFYFYEKFSEYISLNNNCDIKDLCIDAMNSYYNGVFKLEYSMSRQELLLVLNSGIFHFNLINKNRTII